MPYILRITLKNKDLYIGVALNICELNIFIVYS
uniref:Uncharacterized protein n=1 Tax=Dulem virus 42 TaxID=3145760 RepID=A0AAU8B7U0_9CAUD